MKTVSNSFRDMLAHDVANVFLNTNEFAETATYLPREGGPREVAGIPEEDGNFAQSETSIERVESLRWFCSRGTDGITDPQLGDKLRLSDGRTFTFSGDTSQADNASWWVHFERRIPNRLGAGQVNQR